MRMMELTAIKLAMLILLYMITVKLKLITKNLATGKIFFRGDVLDWVVCTKILRITIKLKFIMKKLAIPNLGGVLSWVVCIKKTKITV